MSAKPSVLFWSLLLGVACSTYAQSNKFERQRHLRLHINEAGYTLWHSTVAPFIR
jgi:hypothetical protein